MMDGTGLAEKMLGLSGLVVLDVEDVRLFRFHWGRADRMAGGLMGLGQVTPPAWSSTRSL